eukprot:CAMPEP_0118952644 /NCGR_PEP_ID=MMETSP1169-20130426/55233_1 /TAXON_ID=36882 /ORGANISM="Pyramimonas obovata, Strain CCMP722" /LENGTH=257 /DNA_ID=CAMNT_0006899947 /DNA_START=336 /DNA_END=1106 /DNA_ORIENTATION=-
MGNADSSLALRAEEQKHVCFQKDFAVITLSLIPFSTVPEGLCFACVGDGDLLGNWQSERAIHLEYRNGTHSTSTIIPWAARDYLEFAFVVQQTNNKQYVCSDSSGSTSNRRKLQLEEDITHIEMTQEECIFQIAEGQAGLRCRVRVKVERVTAGELARAVARPKKAYFEQAPETPCYGRASRGGSLDELAPAARPPPSQEWHCAMSEPGGTNAWETLRPVDDPPYVDAKEYLLDTGCGSLTGSLPGSPRGGSRSTSC